MGYNYIAGFLEYGMNVDTALLVHCRSNCFPPIHTDFIPCFKEAIELVDCGEWDTIIEMPNGIKKTAGDIVEGAHLDAFLASEYDDDDYDDDDE